MAVMAGGSFSFCQPPSGFCCDFRNARPRSIAACTFASSLLASPARAGADANGREAGVDIPSQRSEHVDEVKDVGLDYVVTVCAHANESCPIFPGNAKVVHVGFDDPPKLAKTAKTEEEALGHYRRVRDEIRKFIQTLPAALRQNTDC